MERAGTIMSFVVVLSFLNVAVYRAIAGSRDAALKSRLLISEAVIVIWKTIVARNYR
jgi:hypothetical protein